MKYILTRFAQIATFAAVLIAPLVVSAQAVSNVQGLFAWFLNILNQWVVPIIFAMAFIMFLYGVYRFFIAGGDDEEKVKQGQRFVMWSIIGFVLMFTIWGIINLFINTLQFSGANEPGLPQFGANGLTTSGYVVSGGGNSFAGFLGGIFGGTAGGQQTGGVAAGTILTNPSTGQSVVMNGPNTFPAGPGGDCFGMGNLIAGSNNCRPNGTGVPKTQAGGGGAPGSGGSGPFGNTTGTACASNSQCPDICDTITGTCQAAGPNTYFCADDSVPQGGVCKDGKPPQNSNDEDAGAGNLGGKCNVNNDCSDNDGVCNQSTGVCAKDDAQTYSCQGDTSSFDASTGKCSDGTEPLNVNGQPLDGSSASSDGSGSDSSTVTCQDGNTAPAAIGCTTCSDGSTAASDATCPAGTPGSDYGGTVSCEDGNSVPTNIGCTTCSDGSTAASDATCPSGTPGSDSCATYGMTTCSDDPSSCC